MTLKGRTEMYNYFISFVEKSFIRRTYGDMCIGLDFELKDYGGIEIEWREI